MSTKNKDNAGLEKIKTEMLPRLRTKPVLIHLRDGNKIKPVKIFRPDISSF
jgi:hypothetical protein